MTTFTKTLALDQKTEISNNSIIEKHFGLEGKVFPMIELLDSYSLKEEILEDDLKTIYLYGYSQLHGITVGDYLSMEKFLTEEEENCSYSLGESPVTGNPIISVSISEEVLI